MNKKLLITLLCGVLMLAAVNAGLVAYLSNTIRAEVTIDNPIECYFEETGTTYLDLGNLMKTGEPITIEYTTVSVNDADSEVGTFPVTIISGPTKWEGNEFDSVLSCSSFYLSGSETINIDGEAIFCRIITDYLYYVDDYGNLHPFSEIGEDNNIYSTAKIFIDYDGDGIPQKDPLAVGTSKKLIRITLNPNVAAGHYSLRYCHLNEITGQCQGYYYVYSVSE